MASRDRRKPDDLSEKELEHLLAEKRLAARRGRLEEFRRSGRRLPAPERGWESPQSESPQSSARGKPARPPKILDRLLLVVEVGAVVGLAFVLVNGAGLLRELNHEVSQALSRVTPTPLISAVVLPSGHTPPTAPGGARPNDAEIPENLRPLVQSLPLPPVPTRGAEQAVQLDLPTLGEAGVPVVEGDGWEQLKLGVGHHIGSANPGEGGNVVLSGHDDIFGEIFKDLSVLKPGDPVILYTVTRQFSYRVVGTHIVAPTDVGVMGPTIRPTLTLISCYPYLVDTQRIVVVAELQGG
ncbi:MAG: class D sortase [Anaerolineales bacterium]